MSTYDSLRHLADSWGLVAMTAAFLGFNLWAFRPRARAHHDRAARSIFEGDDHE
ncbi:MAG: cbb3-type cytochrome c oxidase subunit 3 [Sphingomonas sp.]|uniref:cbb3-type cytochrome c oxidase subunit 3 n=1 Tax=Sphingomonas sp. TaxID=28214 RepID=UPI0025D85893|nr:cbb3-type cytochrome c oxidase subunit 3 [Sphingomonas sp.]MBX9880968.1 cbb3-type cytochrome c oxidase subunit 3 [Sphingomonas sp.]